MTPSPWSMILLITGVVFLVVAAIALGRRGRRRGRVDGIVVEVAPGVTQHVTFDYPVPGWTARATRPPAPGADGSVLSPGTPLDVYVDPSHPDDPQLVCTRAGRVRAIVFLTLGATAFALGFLLFFYLVGGG